MHAYHGNKEPSGEEGKDFDVLDRSAHFVRVGPSTGVGLPRMQIQGRLMDFGQ